MASTIKKMGPVFSKAAMGHRTKGFRAPRNSVIPRVGVRVSSLFSSCKLSSKPGTSHYYHQLSRTMKICSPRHLTQKIPHHNQPKASLFKLIPMPLHATGHWDLISH